MWGKSAVPYMPDQHAMVCQRATDTTLRNSSVYMYYIAYDA